MRNRHIATILAAAALAAVSPTAASATTAGNTIDTSYGNPQQEEDNDFPWGILGLLGLLGLIPRKKAPDIHVDARQGGPGTRP